MKSPPTSLFVLDTSAEGVMPLLGDTELDVIDMCEDGDVIAECDCAALALASLDGFPDTLCVRVHSSDGFGTFLFHEAEILKTDSGELVADYMCIQPNKGSVAKSGYLVTCLCDLPRGVEAMSDFKGRHFRGEIVLWAVRWYCRYPISYRDLEAMMTERGVAVDHSTIYRWVQRFAPEMEKRLRWQWRRPQSRSWRVDETYIKVRGKWAYLYRAVDKLGNTIDFYLSATRNTKAAKRFLGKALRGLKEWEQPEVLNTDKAPAYAAAIAELKAEGKCPKDTRHRQVKYLNNVIEADHGKLKLLIRPVRGFKTLKTAYATIKGFEVMRALRKGQAGMFALQGGIVGEARIVERAFALGPCALTEAMALLQDRLANAET